MDLFHPMKGALIYFVLVASVVIIGLPYWGPYLRRYRQIQAKTQLVKLERETCGTTHGCPFGDPNVNELKLAMKSRLGPRLSLLFCLNRRLESCFSDWANDMLQRIFVRAILVLVLLLIVFLAVTVFAGNQFVQDFLKQAGVTDANSNVTWMTIILAPVSLSEISVLIEIHFRYRELTDTTQKMLNMLVP